MQTALSTEALAAADALRFRVAVPSPVPAEPVRAPRRAGLTSNPELVAHVQAQGYDATYDNLERGAYQTGLPLYVHVDVADEWHAAQARRAA